MILKERERSGWSIYILDQFIAFFEGILCFLWYTTPDPPPKKGGSDESNTRLSLRTVLQLVPCYMTNVASSCAYARLFPGKFLSRNLTHRNDLGHKMFILQEYNFLLYLFSRCSRN